MERRRSRRWTIFFRLLGIGVVLLLLAIGAGWLQPGEGSGGRHTALIEIDGVIAYGGEVDADMVNAALRSAFEDRQTAAVVMRSRRSTGRASPASSARTRS